MPASLRRELTPASAIALVISNMIGTGIFTTTGFLAGDLGRPSLVLGIWIAGGLVALAGCLCYAELGMNLPRSGGEYVYLREAWGPMWGFLSGWVSFFAGFAAPIAAGALAISEYLGQSLRSAAPDSAQTASTWLHLGWAQFIGVGVVSVLAVVNILGVGVAAKLQNVLTAVKLGVIAAFLTLAFTIGEGQWAHLADSTARTSTHGITAQFAISLIFVMFAYSGWNAASYVAEEMQSPERTLPRVLFIGTALVAVIYLALNLAYVYALPLESLKGVLPVGAASATAMFGSRAGSLFAGLITLGLISTVSAMSLVGPRVYFAMARDGCFPAGAARIHPRWGSPVQAIVYQAVASSVMIVTGTFEALVYYIGFTLILFSALAVAGLMRLRSRPQWRRLPILDFCYPLMPMAFLVASVWILVWTLFGQPKASVLGLLTVAAGGLFYRWKRLSLSRTSDTGPTDS